MGYDFIVQRCANAVCIHARCASGGLQLEQSHRRKREEPGGIGLSRSGSNIPFPSSRAHGGGQVARGMERKGKRLPKTLNDLFDPRFQWGKVVRHYRPDNFEINAKILVDHSIS